MSLKDRAVTGISWSALSQLGREGLGLLTTLVLARLLSPDEFGLLGMVMVFIGFITIFQNLGLGASIIQDQKITQNQLSGIFWLNLGFSILITILVLVTAPFVSGFYNEPSITSIMMVLALNFPLGALAMIPGVMLTKRMEFKKLAIIQNIAIAVGNIVGITMAFMGFGVWALVWQRIIRTLILTLLQWIMVPWSPNWTLSYQKIKKQLSFGIYLQAGSLLNYGTRNVDDLLIGKIIGASSLGVYQMAYRLMLWPLEKVSRVVGNVMFPVLSTIQGEKARVKRVFLRTTRSIAFITFPMVLGVWVIAPSVVYTLLGENWTGVIPIFQILCILGLPQSIGTNTGWIFLSQGRTDIRLKLQIAASALIITSFIIGINWGVMGVVVCYAIASLLFMPIQFQVAGKLINMTFLDVVSATSGVFLCAIIMAVFVLGLGQVLPPHWPHWMYLLTQVPFGVVVYLLLVHFFRLKAYIELKQLFNEYWQLRFAKASYTPSLK